MTITINGNGTVTGISEGGLPDGIVTPADLSNNNTPMWLAKLSSGYSHTSTNTWVTAPLATETFDTDSAFNTSTYTFTVPSGKGGKYWLYYNAEAQDNPDAGENIQGRINKNGSALDYSYTVALSVGTNSTTNVGKGWVETLAAGDTLTMGIYHNDDGLTFSANQTYFGGYRLIGG